MGLGKAAVPPVTPAISTSARSGVSFLGLRARSLFSLASVTTQTPARRGVMDGLGPRALSSSHPLAAVHGMVASHLVTNMVTRKMAAAEAVLPVSFCADLFPDYFRVQTGFFFFCNVCYANLNPLSKFRCCFLGWGVAWWLDAYPACLRKTAFHFHYCQTIQTI